MALHEQSVGKTDEWYTPPHVFKALGCAFDMDVASPGKATVPWVPAKHHITQASLTACWTGFVWMNPPFGGRNGLYPWLQKFIDHGNGIALVPDRTSAPWWQHYVPRADAVLFVAPKIKFIGTDGIYRFWGAGLHWLRQMVFKALGPVDTAASPKLVYLGRQGATHRRVTNEAEVVKALEPLGFVFPNTDGMTPAQQVAIVRDADIVVAAAGANTILTHFAPEHANIITMYPRKMGTGPWGGLGAAMFLRQVHERIECDHVDVPGLFRANTSGVNELSDMTVDVSEVMLKVGLAQAHNGSGVIDDALRL